MARRSSSSWSDAAAGCALAVGLLVSLCAAAPVGASDVTPKPLPHDITDSAGGRPLGSARDLQRPSPALAPVDAPDVTAFADESATAATAVPVNADRLQKALKKAALPASSPVDPVRLLRRLPDGLPDLAYRVCWQVPDRVASCTDSAPSGVPVLVDITAGDSAASPDLLVDALPAASTDALVAAAGLRDPQQRSEALADASAGGLAVTSLRLPTSDVPAAESLRAKVRIDVDLPGGARLSVGLDGAEGLPRAVSATFDIDPSDGITANVRNVGAAAPLGVSVVNGDGAALSARIAGPVPGSVRLRATAGATSRVEVDNSSTSDRVDVALANAGGGAVAADFTRVPKRAAYSVDVADGSAEATSSAALGRVEFHARTPVDGRTWSTAADIAGLRARLSTDFAAGTLSLRSSRGAAASAAVAVTNHEAATVPQSANYLAVHHDATSGDLDAAVSVPDVREVGYARTVAGDQSYELDTGPAVVALDTDVMTGRDLQFFVGGLLTAPASVGIATSGGQLRYTSDQPLGVRLTVAAGKVGALNDLFVPLYDRGVAVRVAECHGSGCATDHDEFCSPSGRCFAVGANIAVDSNAPTLIATDLETGRTTLGERSSRDDDIDVYFARDGLDAHAP